MQNIITVTELNNYIKGLLDNDFLLASTYVKGEISNFKRHSSGHLYFTMKDEGAAIPCVMFKYSASSLRFLPENGMKIIAHGRVSVFPRDGRYQLYADEMQPDGIGALYVAYEQLKERLRLEGLFDETHKLPLPKYPSKIALITSPTGAAVRDMIRVLGRRYPVAKILVVPVRVQGEGAADEISSAIKLVSDKHTVDLIITGRGGGSIEDLWPFNEEIVARAIYASQTPVISAVGHEPDITIADFVSDIRAATPSNGAELAVPDRNEIRITLKNYDVRISKAIINKINSYKMRLTQMEKYKSLKSPAVRINEQRMLLDYYEKSLASSMRRILEMKRSRFGKLEATVKAISPLRVLARGYAIPTIDGHPVTDIASVDIGDDLILRMAGGDLECLVNNKIERKEL